MEPEQLELFPRPRLIGLYSPKAGMGKSEVAKRLVQNHGYLLIKFAGTLKSMVNTMLAELDFSYQERREFIEGHRKEENLPGFDFSTRFLMETLGTTWGRETVDPNLWVNMTMAKVELLLSRGVSVVVDDVRFPNEYDAIHQAGGKMVYINRPDMVGWPRQISEGRLSGMVFDYAISNNGTYHELNSLVEKLAEVLQDNENGQLVLTARGESI